MTPICPLLPAAKEQPGGWRGHQALSTELAPAPGQLPGAPAWLTQIHELEWRSAPHHTTFCRNLFSVPQRTTSNLPFAPANSQLSLSLSYTSPQHRGQTANLPLLYKKKANRLWATAGSRAANGPETVWWSLLKWGGKRSQHRVSLKD